MNKEQVSGGQPVMDKKEKFERVEFYAGGNGQEKPLAVYRAGERHLIEKVISKKRIMDSRTGRIKEVFECQLAGGEKIEIERELEQDQSRPKR